MIFSSHIHSLNTENPKYTLGTNGMIRVAEVKCILPRNSKKSAVIDAKKNAQPHMAIFAVI